MTKPWQADDPEATSEAQEGAATGLLHLQRVPWLRRSTLPRTSLVGRSACLQPLGERRNMKIVDWTGATKTDRSSKVSGSAGGGSDLSFEGSSGLARSFTNACPNGAAHTSPGQRPGIHATHRPIPQTGAPPSPPSMSRLHPHYPIPRVAPWAGMRCPFWAKWTAAWQRQTSESWTLKLSSFVAGCCGAR